MILKRWDALGTKQQQKKRPGKNQPTYHSKHILLSKKTNLITLVVTKNI